MSDDVLPKNRSQEDALSRGGRGYPASQGIRALLEEG
jgi:hypothetical protein